MDKYASLSALITPLVIGVFGAGGAGTWYFRYRSGKPANAAEIQKVGAEASMIVIEGFQRLTDTLQKQCATLSDRIEILEKKSLQQEEARVVEKLEYEKRINILQIEMASVISSSNYKDKQLEEQAAQIITLKERVTYLEGELRKYNATLI